MAKFAKGKSGNPGGRPKDDLGLKELCRARATDAVGTLVAIMNDEKSPASARVASACAVLDRGYGKPLQMNEHTGANGAPLVPSTMDNLELARRMAFILSEADGAIEKAAHSSKVAAKA